MRTLPVYTLAGTEKGKITLPQRFSEKVRHDLIIRAILAENSWHRQPYGPNAIAGQRSSAHYHGRRGTRQSQMNKEMARSRRIHNQGYLNLTSRILPHAVKGRMAHPPLVEKIWKLKINRKERRKALDSALAAVLEKDLIVKRGHRVANAKHIPLVLVDDLEKLKKTREVIEVLEKLGFGDELERCSETKVRAGKGKMRGRKYKKKKGPLIVIGKDEGIMKAGKNIPGVDVVTAEELTVHMLAPGTHPGRLAIFTESAIEALK